MPPPPDGSIFRIVEFPPETGDLTGVNNEEILKEMGITPSGDRGEKPRHHNMHRTNSIDYAIVMSGEIDLYLDDSEVHLKQGDVVVQRATNHAWVNRSDKPCKIAFILIDDGGSSA